MSDRKTGMLIIFIFGILLFPGIAYGQLDFSRFNLTIKYRPTDNIPMRYQVTKNKDQIILFFSLDIPTQVNFNENYSLYYEIKKEYGSSNSLTTQTLYFSTSGIGEENGKKYFRIEIDDTENQNILILRLTNNLSEIEYVWDIPLHGSITYEPPDFYLCKSDDILPYLDSYLNMGDSLRIVSTDSSLNTFYIYHYEHTFSQADPPMYRLDKNVSRALQIDTLFTINSGEPLSLEEEGLYFIQSDTSTFSGISIRAEERFYPKPVRIEDVIDPVIYLTTRQEINRLKENKNPREAFEKFWLNLSASEDQASRLIREYFNQVEIVNEMFTNYKQGWKTDMGMIYIIFGPPDEVYNNGETESWYYRQQAATSTIVFNFLRLKSIFTHHHYLLIRDKEYRNPWFKAIEDWRRGRINR